MGKACMRVRKGLTVCVVPSKDLEKKDVIVTDTERRRAKSMRSVTELQNTLFRLGASDLEIEKTMNFVDMRLRPASELENAIGIGRKGINWKKSQKK